MASANLRDHFGCGSGESSSAARGQGIGSELLSAAVAAAAPFERQLFVYTAVAPWYQHRGWSVAETSDDDGHFVLERSV